jgi:DNA invertase Pin-like site-specific DNA recombinase
VEGRGTRTTPQAGRFVGFHNSTFLERSRPLGESWCDTTTDAGRLMLTIMGGIAEFERGLIRKRTDERIERAKRQGKKFGRPERLDAGQKQVIADRHGRGATIPELAEEYGVGVGTIWRALQPTAIEARKA